MNFRVNIILDHFLKDVTNVFKPFSAAGSLCDPTPKIFLDVESLWQQNYRKTLRRSTKGNNLVIT